MIRARSARRFSRPLSRPAWSVSSDLNAAEPEGFALSPVNQRRGRRWSVADGYLKPARSRGNLTVLTGTHATRIVLESGRAVGVDFLEHGRPEHARATKEVIVCAGAINSPQLLLLSGIGPAGQLAAVGVEPVHDLPGVGRNLQDHLAAGLLVASTGAKTLYSAESPLNLARFLLLGRGPLTSNVAEAVGLVRSRPELSAPDLELLFAPVLFTDEGLHETARGRLHGGGDRAAARQRRQRRAPLCGSARPAADRPGLPLRSRRRRPPRPR